MVRFCVAVNHRSWLAGEPQATLDLATAADALGFDSIWVSEDPDGWDAFALLAAMSRCTTQLRLGSGVTNPYLRHPNLIAASVATLDQLSAGRAFLGLGRGQPEWFAGPFDFDASQPLQRLETTIDLLRQWWQPPYVASSETPPVVRHWERSIHPVGQPPIYLAAVGPRALALAGRKADGVLFNELATPQFVKRAVIETRSAAVAAGRDPDQLMFFVNPATRITNDPGQFLERKKAFIALVHALPGMERLLETDRFDVAQIMLQVRRAMGTGAILASGGAFNDLRKHGDLAAAKRAIPVGLVAEGAAIGSIEEVELRLRTFIEAGATHLFMDAEWVTESPGEVQALIQKLDAANVLDHP